MKRILSKSNGSRHENEKLPRNPVPLTKSTHSHAFSREHSTMIVHVRRRQRVNRGLLMSAADVTNLKASYRHYRPVK